MNRKGRVLLVDDDERWRNVLSDTLEQGGFQTDFVGTTTEALACLAKTFYHLAVLDIRLEEGDLGNAEGMSLLKHMTEYGLLGGMEVIMLSAYGTKEQMRQAFAKYGVTDFLSKDLFDDQEFLEQVRQVFSEGLRINLDLAIHWQQLSDAEQAVINLELGGTRVRRDSPFRTGIATELDDLLCRLFHKAESVLIKPLISPVNSSIVLSATPFYSDGAGQPVVVKISDFRRTNVEYKNFKEHAQPFIGGSRSTNVMELSRTPRLGGMVYSLLGGRSDQLETFSSFYSRADISQIKEILNRLFHETCGVWYANPGHLMARNLTTEYQQLLGFSPEVLNKTLADNLKSVQGKQKLHFTGLSNGRTFTNPMLTLASKQFVRSTYVCTTHGDLHPNNILVDHTGYVWLIDFEDTGPGHILRDIVLLDLIVRCHLLKPEEATLDERLEMEEMLCSVEQFSQLDSITDKFQTNNQALLKAYMTAVHLRKTAHRLIIQNPSDDISEYYIALFYCAINSVRFLFIPSLQRQHALLCAGLLCERLK
jgi:CheY-like chemotaxis protein